MSPLRLFLEGDHGYSPMTYQQLGGREFHWSTSQANLPKLNSNTNNTLYPLAYYQVLLQHLNRAGDSLIELTSLFMLMQAKI
jgi:hypothetical protein